MDLVTFCPAHDLSLKGDMEIGSTLEALNSDQLTDEEVVERVKAGHTPLYEIIMRRYNQRLYRVARAILRDDAEAEDVMQDTSALIRICTSSPGRRRSPPG
jgi:hypothetical protein